MVRARRGQARQNRGRAGDCRRAHPHHAAPSLGRCTSTSSIVVRRSVILPSGVSRVSSSTVRLTCCFWPPLTSVLTRRAMCPKTSPSERISDLGCFSGIARFYGCRGPRSVAGLLAGLSQQPRHILRLHVLVQRLVDQQ